jgi:hypothetical protein
MIQKQVPEELIAAHWPQIFYRIYLLPVRVKLSSKTPRLPSIVVPVVRLFIRLNLAGEGILKSVQSHNINIHQKNATKMHNEKLQ